MDARFEIRIEGHLDAAWAEWFEGVAVACRPDGTTIISTAVLDQAALQGLLRQIADLGLSLVSVNAARPPG